MGRDHFREKDEAKKNQVYYRSNEKSERKHNCILSLTPPRIRPRRESGWDVFPHQLAEYQETNPGIIMTPLTTDSTVGISLPGPVSQKTRHARRSYIGNLPDGCNDDEIRDFLTGALTAVGGVTMAGEPVLSIYINR